MESKFVIETMLADGPHWYSGIAKTQKINPKTGESYELESPLWSPFWDDRKELNEPQARMHLAVALHDAETASIVAVENAARADSRKLLTNNQYEMRGCYLQKNMQCILPGYTAVMNVVNVTDTEIKMKAANGGDYMYLSRKSEKWVRVVGIAQPKKERIA